MKLITEKIKEKFEQYPIGSQDGKGANAKVIVKFFNPVGVGTWYILEGTKINNEDYEMFGYCHLGDDELAEFGTVYLSELQNLKLPLGLSIERDLYLQKDIDLMQSLKQDGIKPHQYLINSYKDNDKLNLYRAETHSVEEKLKQKLQEKILKEYNNFIELLKKEQPKVIIEKAYEKVCKEEIVYCFEKKNLNKNELKALLKSPNILEETYNHWLKLDGNFNELLEYCVDNKIKHITDKYREELKQKDNNIR